MEVIKGKDYKIEWNGQEFIVEMDKIFKKEVEKKAAKNIAIKAKTNLLAHNHEGIKRAVYKKGKYAGLPWTAREPGRLAKSIKAYKSKYKNGGWIVMAGGYLPFYAWMVEFGTPQSHAKPYLRPAVEAERNRLFYYLKDAARKSKYFKAV